MKYTAAELERARKFSTFEVFTPGKGREFSLVKAAEKFGQDAKVDAKGVVRWRSNDQVPPRDVLVIWADLALPFDFDASEAARVREMEAFFSEYRAQQPAQPSAEELYEMRAAFGPGVDVVDVISGRRVRT